MDLRRSIDYLETRTDVDHNRLSYYAVSSGAVLGPILLAVEPRLKVAVVVAGGCDSEKELPEADPLNFAPHVKVPTLMMNGRYDFMAPLDTCQEPLFRALGTPSQDKRHVLFDTGHSPPQTPRMKEALNWLDKYLGPVKGWRLAETRFACVPTRLAGPTLRDFRSVGIDYVGTAAAAPASCSVAKPTPALAPDASGERMQPKVASRG